MKKKIYVVLLSVILLLNLGCEVFAFNSADVDKGIYYNENGISSYTYKNDLLYEELLSYGFSNEEILDLYQKEADKENMDLYLPEKLAKKIGIKKVYHNTFPMMSLFYESAPGREGKVEKYIDFNEVATKLGWIGGSVTSAVFIASRVTKSQFMKALAASAGLGWFGVTTFVASSVFAGLSYWHKGVILKTDRKWACDDWDGCKWIYMDIYGL